MGFPDDQYKVPATQTAVITTADGRHSVSHVQPVPATRSASVLVRVHAVSLNPTDHKTPANVKVGGLTSGCDFSGEVVFVTEEANEEAGKVSELGVRRWAPADRVFGVVYGSNPGDPDWGAFAEFVWADPVMLCRMPDEWSYETAASVGGSVHGSVALCLFGGAPRMGLSLDRVKQAATDHRDSKDLGEYPSSIRASDLDRKVLNKVVLVYGGSTACGTMALQMLRLAGYIPITTCSPRNTDLVTSYGAAAVFDYHRETCAQEIKQYTKSALAYAIDCVGNAHSAALCYEAIGRAGGQYVALEKYPESVAAQRKVVKPSWVMGPIMFGRPLQLGEGYSQPVDPTARAFARVWYPLAEALFSTGKLRSHPVRIMGPGEAGATNGGWPETVISGLGDLRDGVVSAQKLVVKLMA